MLGELQVRAELCAVEILVGAVKLLWLIGRKVEVRVEDRKAPTVAKGVTLSLTL
jgi:hypothetical protein